MRKPILILGLLLLTTQAQAQMTISAMGDILVHEALYIEAQNSPEGFYSLFKTVKPLLDQADFSYGNLEGCVAPGVNSSGVNTTDPGFKYDKNVYSGTNFLFNYHKSLITDLQKLGVDLVSTANNHSLDRGSLGAERTIESLNSAGMLFNGTRTAGSSPTITWTTVKGHQVGWIACTEETNGLPDKKNQVLKCFKDQAAIEAMVTQYRNYILILTPHWGVENSMVPNQNQKTWAKRMAEIGATAIIGNHPHVLQPIEWISTTDARRVLVAYSLGNFLAWQKGTEKKASVILYLEFDAAGKLASYYYRPTWRGGNWVMPYQKSFGPEPLQYIQKILGPSPK
ncbi:MAG: CapA family protein [Bdellovibrionota bacterium]